MNSSTSSSQTAHQLRYLWAYSAANDHWRKWNERLIAKRQARGFDVKGFCLTPPELNNAKWLPFPDLDFAWRTAHPPLLEMYERMEEELRDRDVLVHYNGANLHPDFVRCLPVFKVYTAGDDPESTSILTRPVAGAYNLHLVNNVACLDMYKSWGLPHVYFWPLGSTVFVEDMKDLDENALLDISTRDIPIALFCGRSPWRNDRLDALAESFPEAYIAGAGWPRGFVDDETVRDVLRRAQIGWNIHNSTGPINFRTYDLPAYGIMQICDNKSHLDGLFKVNQEVVGFNNIEECIELTRYYLEHPEEQRRIALAGHKRWLADYTPDRVWDKLTDIVSAHFTADDARSNSRSNAVEILRQQRTFGPIRRLVLSPIRFLRRISQRAHGYVARRIKNAQSVN